MKFGDNISLKEQEYAETIEKHLSEDGEAVKEEYIDSCRRWLELAYFRYQAFLLENQELLVEWEHQGKQLDKHKQDILYAVNEINQATLYFVENKNSTRFEKENLKKQERIIIPTNIQLVHRSALYTAFTAINNLSDLVKNV